MEQLKKARNHHPNFKIGEGSSLANLRPNREGRRAFDTAGGVRQRARDMRSVPLARKGRIQKIGGHKTPKTETGAHLNSRGGGTKSGALGRGDEGEPQHVCASRRKKMASPSWENNGEEGRK